MAPLSDWLVTAVNHRLKQYKHPLLLALVLLALNTAFFVSMTFYLADGPEMEGKFGPYVNIHMAMQDPAFQKQHKEIFEQPQFTLTECAVCNDGPCTCCTGTQCPAADDAKPEIFFTALVSMCGCAARNTCAPVDIMNPGIEDTVPGCHYTYKDASWADAIGIAGGYVALVDSFFTMIIIIIYLTCTGQPPAAVMAAARQSMVEELAPLIAEQVGVVLEGMSLKDLEQGKAASTSSGSKSQGKGKDKSKKTKNPLDEEAE